MVHNQGSIPHFSEPKIPLFPREFCSSVTLTQMGSKICRLLGFARQTYPVMGKFAYHQRTRALSNIPGTSNYTPQISPNVIEAKMGKKGEIHIIAQITTTPPIG